MLKKDTRTLSLKSLIELCLVKQLGMFGLAGFLQRNNAKMSIKALR